MKLLLVRIAQCCTSAPVLFFVARGSQSTCFIYGNAVQYSILLTIIESSIFSKYWPDYWTEDERGEFAAFLAADPKAGVVIPPFRRLSQGALGC
jgi:hypothetical protein